ncbi:MAG: DUF4365 domain-containing protein [Bacteroidetes bacterium]|nr:DUF4365 domain-containing protein [Bacteroidota bacterium]
MPLKRHPNKIIEREGVNYIRSLVESANCIVTEIDTRDDLGIDCYIDFTINDFATGFTISAQIKSGKSFKDSRGYKIVAGRDHLDRWANHTLQVAGLVYDPDKKCAFWISISDYLRDHPEAVTKASHTIRLSNTNVLNEHTFESFRTYFINRITDYKTFENFGRSLNEFSDFANPERCYNGLKSLFSNHRDKEAAWTYIITSFEHIQAIGIKGNILGMLSNFLDNGNIFWNSQSQEYAHYQMSSIRTHVANTIKKHFSPGSVEQAISFLKDGITRHAFPYLVFLVLNQVEGIDEIIHKLASNESRSIEERQHLYWLYAHFAQHRSKEFAIARIRDFVSKNPDDDGILRGTIETIEREGYIQTG